MDVLAQFLDGRDENEAFLRDADFPPAKILPAERLTKFDAWLFRQLARRIDWQWAGDAVAQGRRINQARLYVERMVLALWRRGWLLDGSALAKRIVAPLDTIAEYQRKGDVKAFWPYFCATIDRYVGVNSEEIQLESKRIGATMGQIVGLLGLNQPQNDPSLTELLARRAEELENAKSSLREKQKVLRAKEREITAEEGKQLRLL